MAEPRAKEKNLKTAAQGALERVPGAAAGAGAGMVHSEGIKLASEGAAMADEMHGRAGELKQMAKNSREYADFLRRQATKAAQTSAEAIDGLMKKNPEVGKDYAQWWRQETHRQLNQAALADLEAKRLARQSLVQRAGSVAARFGSRVVLAESAVIGDMISPSSNIDKGEDERMRVYNRHHTPGTAGVTKKITVKGKRGKR